MALKSGEPYQVAIQFENRHLVTDCFGGFWSRFPDSLPYFLKDNLNVLGKAFDVFINCFILCSHLGLRSFHLHSHHQGIQTVKESIPPFLEILIILFGWKVSRLAKNHPGFITQLFKSYTDNFTIQVFKVVRIS